MSSASSEMPVDAWPRGPRAPQLTVGALHVWRADLDAVGEETAALISPVERERAARIAGERERVRWSRARGLLRELLGVYLRRDPRALPLTAGANGKPTLGGPQALSFNLSHSGGTALYVFASAGPVGVDVELARGGLDALALAGRAFGPAETQRLRELDPCAREQEFLRSWVRHEAKLKCLGTGLGGSDAIADERAPWVAELEIGPRAAGAVAALERPTRLSCWGWPSRRADVRPRGSSR